MRSDGQVVVTLPKRLSVSWAEHFVQEKIDWIRQRLTHLEQLRKNSPIKNDPASLKSYKKSAEQLVRQKLVFFNQFYGFKYHKVTIRDQRSRWGSCSRQGNLNFNYRLALLPERLVDYIVVHELCHLGQMNHSAKFWALVAKQLPDYLVRRKELKKVSLF